MLLSSRWKQLAPATTGLAANQHNQEEEDQECQGSCLGLSIGRMDVKKIDVREDCSDHNGRTKRPNVSHPNLLSAPAVRVSPPSHSRDTLSQAGDSVKRPP